MLVFCQQQLAAFPTSASTCLITRSLGFLYLSASSSRTPAPVPGHSPVAYAHVHRRSIIHALISRFPALSLQWLFPCNHPSQWTNCSPNCAPGDATAPGHLTIPPLVSRGRCIAGSLTAQRYLHRSPKPAASPINQKGIGTTSGVGGSLKRWRDRSSCTRCQLRRKVSKLFHPVRKCTTQREPICEDAPAPAFVLQKKLLQMHKR